MKLQSIFAASTCAAVGMLSTVLVWTLEVSSSGHSATSSIDIIPTTTTFVVSTSHPPPVPTHRDVTAMTSFANADDHCDKILGQQFVDELRGSARALCDGRSKIAFHVVANDDARRFVYVDGRNFVLDTSKMSLPLGPSAVSESHEYYSPYERGAFGGQCTMASRVDIDNAISLSDAKSPGPQTLQEQLRALDAQHSSFSLDTDCDQWIEEPVYLVQRIEYANLYHTYTEWFAALFALTSANLVDDADNAVNPVIEFFDEHEAAVLDDTWRRLFGASRRFSSHRPHVRVCYRRLLLAAPGYHSRLFRLVGAREECTAPRVMETIRSRMLASHGIVDEGVTSRRENITIIVRRPYVAHPRNPSGRVDRRWFDEAAVVRALVDEFGHERVNVVDLATISFAAQLRVIASTRVLVGVHGAGLTHVAFLRPSSVAALIEVSATQQMHFENLAHLTNVTYERVRGVRRGETIDVDRELLVDAINRTLARE